MIFSCYLARQAPTVIDPTAPCPLSELVNDLGGGGRFPKIEDAETAARLESVAKNIKNFLQPTSDFDRLAMQQLGLL